MQPKKVARLDLNVYDTYDLDSAREIGSNKISFSEIEPVYHTFRTLLAKQHTCTGVKSRGRLFWDVVDCALFAGPSKCCCDTYT